MAKWVNKAFFRALEFKNKNKFGLVGQFLESKQTHLANSMIMHELGKCDWRSVGLCRL